MDTARTRRLKWHCRRGMKELDLLLGRFIEHQQSTLGDGRWPELENLLETEDDQLWEWLQNPTLPAARPYRELLERIRRDSD